MPRSANNTLTDDFASALTRLEISSPVAVAVSGGGDSLALMHLMAAYCAENGFPAPQVVTVDHALRPGSDTESQKVADWAKAAGLVATLLTRTGPVPQSDIEAEARLARYQLMGTWAKAEGIKTILLAHTEDDQAETFLMRLIRGSGVDGLSAMQPVAPYPLSDFADDLVIARPLLGMHRTALRRYLRQKGCDWIEDPMNDDPRFTRVRLRKAWPELAALGFNSQRLADTAKHLSRVRKTLEEATKDLQGRITHSCDAGCLIDGNALVNSDAEIALRLISSVLMDVGGQVYRPRFARLERLYEAVLAGKLGAGRTLHGCKIGRAPRRMAHFGPSTILISVEKTRKTEPKQSPLD